MVTVSLAKLSPKSDTSTVRMEFDDQFGSLYLYLDNKGIVNYDGLPPRLVCKNPFYSSKDARARIVASELLLTGTRVDALAQTYRMEYDVSPIRKMCNGEEKKVPSVKK